MKLVRVGNIELGANRPLSVIAGPCVIESRESALRHAAALKQKADRAGVPYIFKSSFDKANRSSLNSFRGPGVKTGLEILAQVKREIGVPILTDVHESDQVAAAAQVADVLQIRASLCRQTHSVVATAKSGRVMNVNKGQFLAPCHIANVLQKILSTLHVDVLVAELGGS